MILSHIVGQGFAALTETRLQRGTCGEALETISVVGTGASKRIPLRVTREADVSHLEAGQPVEGFAVHDDAAADTRPNGEVERVRIVFARAPFGLAKPRYDHIHFDRDGQGKFFAQHAE